MSLEEFGSYFEQDDDLCTCSYQVKKNPLTYKICFGDFFFAYAKQVIPLGNGQRCATIMKCIRETINKTRHDIN